MTHKPLARAACFPGLLLAGFVLSLTMSFGALALDMQARGVPFYTGGFHHVS